MEAPWQARITQDMLDAERKEKKMEHEIVSSGETTSVSSASRRQGGSTGAWGTGGDRVVSHGYHCTRCGAQGETHEQINQKACQPMKG